MPLLNGRRLMVTAAGFAALGAALGGLAGGSTAVSRARAIPPAPTPPLRIKARRLPTRPGAVTPGTKVRSSALFSRRVFWNARVGFALADVGQAQYPARTTDGGRRWRIDGPQVHVNAADAPEAVGYVGVAGRRTYFAYGSSAVDVTTNGGRTWWEAYLGDLVMAVVPGYHGHLVAYVQQSVSDRHPNHVVIWQYVSRDGGRHWRYSTALGG